MPTIPLYITPANPDAWHRVESPGGYEVWHCEAEGSQTGDRLIITFSQASPADPEYRRQYERYLKHPTRHAPPRPCEFARVEMQDGTRNVVAQVKNIDVDISDDGTHVRMGNDHFVREPDGIIRVRACGVELLFRPVEHRATQEFSLTEGAAQHRCVTTDVTYQVEGDSRFDKGFTYHTWGTAPPTDRIVRERDEWLSRLRAGSAGCGGRIIDRG